MFYDCNDSEQYYKITITALARITIIFEKMMEIWPKPILVKKVYTLSISVTSEISSLHNAWKYNNNIKVCSLFAPSKLVDV
jgi:hypothetical protein